MHNEEERADEKEEEKKKNLERQGWGAVVGLGDITNGHCANNTKANPVLSCYKTRYFNLKASNMLL